MKNPTFPSFEKPEALLHWFISPAQQSSGASDRARATSTSSPIAFHLVHFTPCITA